MSAASPKRVVLLAGGRSSEREVSLASGEAVRQGLTAQGHDVVAVEIGRDGRWFPVDKFGPEEAPAGEPIAVVPGEGLLNADVVFPVLHGPFGEDGVIQGTLESLEVPYVGSGVAASAICLDKLLFKEVAGRAGIPQVSYVAVTAEDWRDERKNARLLDDAAALGFPLFVKPARLGSSVGISRVAERGDLASAIDGALKYDPRVIVEAGSDGAEIECSVLGNSEVEVSQPGRLEFDADWYDFDSKYEAGGMRLIAPAPIGESLEIELATLAARVFKLVGCSGMARVDFFVEGGEGAEKILVNEINTIPGFTQTSVYAKLFEASGLPYGDLLDRLLDLAIERHRTERGYSF